MHLTVKGGGLWNLCSKSKILVRYIRLNFSTEAALALCEFLCII